MKIQVISPWYPNQYSPYSGKFVHSQVHALIDNNMDVTVEVPRSMPLRDRYVSKVFQESIVSVASKNVDHVFPTHQEATFIPCPLPINSGALEIATAYETGIKTKRDFLPYDSDIVHAHLALPTGLASKRLDDRPIVITEHQSNLKNVLSDHRTKEAYLEVVESADVFVCVSEFLKDYLIDIFGSGLSKTIEIIPNIVDFNSLDFIQRERYDSLSWIYVGSLFQHKGIVRLLKTFNMYKRHVAPRATLTLVGTGPLIPWVKKYAKRKGIRDSVFLVGAQPHEKLRNYFSKADLLVHLSKFETFGIVSLEAIASGIPVVSFHNGGSEDTWKNISGLCGRLLDDCSKERDIVDAIIDLTKHADDLDLHAARSNIRERFSDYAVASKLSTIYKRLIS